MTPKHGPHLGAAVICEQVLEEKTGVLSLIRMVDRMVITARGIAVPSEMPPGQVHLTLVVTLKSGDARGRHTLFVWPEVPSGQRLPKTGMPVLFEGEDRGVNAVFQIGLELKEEGLYWFDVILDEDQYLTRVPLRIVYQPIQSSSS